MNNAFPVLYDFDKPHTTHGEEAVTVNAAAQRVSEMIKYKKALQSGDMNIAMLPVRNTHSHSRIISVIFSFFFYYI